MQQLKNVKCIEEKRIHKCGIKIQSLNVSQLLPQLKGKYLPKKFQFLSFSLPFNKYRFCFVLSYLFICLLMTVRYISRFVLMCDNKHRLLKEHDFFLTTLTKHMLSLTNTCFVVSHC